MLVNLDRHAVAVRNRLEEWGLGDSCGLGLWLSAETAAELADNNLAMRQLSEWFAERRLIPYTINAFPYGDFHRVRVKHSVYMPEWWTAERADYTLNVAKVFHRLLPNGEPGTISTLPIGWPSRNTSDEHLQEAARQFGRVAEKLAELEETSGRHLRICIEPEPGCLLSTASDVVDFFEDHLHDQVASELVDQHLGVCHDICHAAVMFESQDEVLSTYQTANIAVGKVQVSSAIVAKSNDASDGQRRRLIEELSAFAEDRYLHQTMVCSPGERRLFEDLPLAIERWKDQETHEWRVHFHVPIFLDTFGQLNTSRSEINACLSSLKRLEMHPALEVETYAWSVLPEDLRPSSLADGIAQEIRWLVEHEKRSRNSS